MSVVINSNFAATLAANNLASSNQALQRSLNRLSSGSKIVNPADDAGGLAVSMKLSSAAKRLGATASNLGNSISFLQSQDGVLKTIGKVLDRIGELKTLASDPTKNSSDLDNYNAEFTALQDQIESLADETFNGKALFGSTDLSVATTEDGTGSVQMTAVNLLGTATGAVTNFSFDDISDNSTFTPTGPGVFEVTSGGIWIADNNNMGGTRVWLDNVGDKAIYDGAGGWTLSGSGVNGLTGSFASGVTQLYIEGSMNNSYVGTGSFTPGEPTDVGAVTDAADLSSLALSDVTGALQDLATFRAENGALQSRLGYAAEVLSTNKANLEAANSRITDVDVAVESTQMARYNILVQAGTAMLSQANQSAQSALRLIG